MSRSVPIGITSMTPIGTAEHVELRLPGPPESGGCGRPQKDHRPRGGPRLIPNIDSSVRIWAGRSYASLGRNANKNKLLRIDATTDSDLDLDGVAGRPSNT